MLKLFKNIFPNLLWVRNFCFIFVITKTNNIMSTNLNTFNKIVEIIKTNGRKDVGTIQTNKDGVKYQYVMYHLDTPFHWVVKTFEKAQIEVYGGTTKARGGKLDYDFRRLNHEKINIHCEYPQFKGQSPKKISISELVILE